MEIILVRPQLPENIGTTARAMLNCNLHDLRLVNPRCGWPNRAAYPATSGADVILDNATCFASVKDSIADLQYVLATTARNRELLKPILSLDVAIDELLAHAVKGEKCGILFGPERTGLENSDLEFANAFLVVDLNPDFSSLNVAQAVLLVAYTIFSKQHMGNSEQKFNLGYNHFVAKSDIDLFLTKLEKMMNNGRFFKNEAMRHKAIENLRNLFFRSAITDKELRTLYGLLKK